MGAIHFSLSSELLEFCSGLLPIKTFVETGTFRGDSAAAAAPYFTEVLSVELSDQLYAAASKRFASAENVRIHHGGSPEFLERVREELSGKPVLFWLDAHWCHADHTAGADSQTPILQELDAIHTLHPESILLIDDARLYLCAPPKPHVISDWPDIDDLVRKLHGLSDSHRLIVLDDVIIFYPRHLQRQFAEYAHKNGVNWLDIVHIAETATNPFSGVVHKRRARLEADQVDGRRMDISVVIPTLNCMAFLPEHLESIESWISQVNEVIVVDSHSEDGTAEAIKKYLDHPNLKILTHPRGLYQSWNFGIRQTTSKYVYVSTVGDSIDGEHLALLESLADKTNADVVISPPHFVEEDGKDAKHVRWPIQSILETYPELQEIQLGPLTAFLFSAIHVPCSILGSSASNLYRGDHLRVRPFPDDCSIVGDTAWSLLYSTDAKFHFTRKIGSTFRLHNKPPDMSKTGVLHGVTTRLLGEAEKIAGDLQAKGAITSEEHHLIIRIIRGDRAVSEARDNFTNARKDSILPWYLSKNSRNLRALKKSLISDSEKAKSLLTDILSTNR